MLQYFFYVMDQKEETFKIRKRRTKSTETTIHQLLEALPNTSPEEFVKQFTHAFADTVPSSTRKRRSKKSTSLAASLYSVSNEESLCVAEESPVDPLS